MYMLIFTLFLLHACQLHAAADGFDDEYGDESGYRDQTVYYPHPGYLPVYAPMPVPVYFVPGYYYQPAYYVPTPMQQGVPYQHQRAPIHTAGQHIMPHQAIPVEQPSVAQVPLDKGRKNFFKYVYRCNLKEFRKCIERGIKADPYAQDESDGRPALIKAVIKRDINNNKDRYGMVDVFMSYCCEPDGPRYNELTALQAACESGSYSGAVAMMRHGASLTARTATGTYPLHLALGSSISPSNKYDLCEVLLRKARNLGEDITALRDDEGWAPLLVAVENVCNGVSDCNEQYFSKKLEIIRLLLAHTHDEDVLKDALSMVARAQQKNKIPLNKAQELKHDIRLKKDSTPLEKPLHHNKEKGK